MPRPLLTNAAQVLSLGIEGAVRSPHPVWLKAVVTYPVIRRPWFYAQDATGGILVIYTNQFTQPAAGELVEIRGGTIPGLSAPHVMATEFHMVGTAPLPQPQRADPMRLVAGENFGQWISLEGRVLDLFIYPGQLSLLLQSGEIQFVANIRLAAAMPMPLDWLGARVEVQGVCWTQARSDGVATGFRLHSPGAEKVRILERGNSNHFAGRLVTANALRDKPARREERVRVFGTVTFADPERSVFLHDDTGGMKALLLRRITTPDLLATVNAETLFTNRLSSTGLAPYTVDRSFEVPLQPGDRVEVVGTQEAGNPDAVLVNATYRRVSAGEPLQATAASLADVVSGRRENDLLTIRARLIDRESHQNGSMVEDLLVLRDGQNSLQVRLTSDRAGVLPALPRNALLRVTGVCASEGGKWRAGRTPQFLLRSAADVTVLGQPPAWESWHPERILMVALVVGMASAAWIWFLRRRVAVRTAELARSNEQLHHEVEERKRAEAELARALETERELSQLKSRFVSMVSHEFRTPLGVILASADLLSDYLDTLTPEERAEQITDIKQSTRHMASLMDDVLVLGRVEAGRMDCHPRSLDLADFCQRLIDEMLSATNRQCPIEFVATGVDGAARGDETLLRHIFHNLLSNGVKYSPPGAAVQFHVLREGDAAVFTVKDTGIGIPAADLKHMFDAFYRGKNVGERPGSGLGLVIVKRCVELHGGSIEIQSVEGQGTTATVRLPLFTKPGQTDLLRRSDLAVAPQTA